MLDKMLKLYEAVSKTWFDEKDEDILYVLFHYGRQRQYELEKNLKQLGKSIAHSTVSAKLQRLHRYGWVILENKDRAKFYEITPRGLGPLIIKKRVDFDDLLSYFWANGKQIFDFLVTLNPNLRERLKDWPFWSSLQLTQDLWAHVIITNRRVLRLNIFKFLLTTHRKRRFEDFITDPVTYKFEFKCSNKIKFKGEDYCTKRREKCEYEKNQVVNCDIIKRQIEREFEKLEKEIKRNTLKR